MLGLRGQSCLSTSLVFTLSSSATLEGNVRQDSSIDTVYFPFREYSGTRVEFEPFTNGEVCASVRHLDEKFLPHLALLCRAGETRLEDVVDVVVVIAVDGGGVGMECENWKLLGFSGHY